jgi:hypothetical protein
MRDVWSRLFIVLGLALFLGAAGCDNDDDDNAQEDPPVSDPSSYILTSGYGDQFFVFSGDTYGLLETVTPDLTGDMTGVRDATLVSFLGVDDQYVVFMSLPQEEYGNAQMFSTLGLTGTHLERLTDIDRPGMGQMVPTGSNGLLFIAVRAGTLAQIMKMDLMESEPSPLSLIPPSLPTGANPCLTTSWQSPAYSPAGDLKAFGYHCKVEEGSELPSKTAVVAYDGDSQECGDPIYLAEVYENIEDVSFTYDSSMILFSVGHHAADKRIYARMADASEELVELTAAFNDGAILNFDCDPTSGRIVFNDREVNPNLYILEYEIGDGITISGNAVQITTEGTFRRPRWVKNLAAGRERADKGIVVPR